MFDKPLSLYVTALMAGVAVAVPAARYPVPSRLTYGPTVPIAKAAAEAALGYAASGPIAKIAPAPLVFGARMPKSQPLSVSASINSLAHTAYPAAVSVAYRAPRLTAVSRVAAPRYAGPIYSGAPIYNRGLIAAPALAPAPIVARAPVLAATAPVLAPVATAPHAAAVAVVYRPQPYSFGYQSVDEHGNHQSRQETSDANNFKKGSYSYTDASGISRRVDYVADAAGFRATINTNEPGTAPSAPAAALYMNSAHRKA